MVLHRKRTESAGKGSICQLACKSFIILIPGTDMAGYQPHALETCARVVSVGLWGRNTPWGRQRREVKGMSKAMGG